MRDLPEDIILDILLRLPFESVMALKCVSNQIKQLIDDPDFSKRYGVPKAVTFPGIDNLYYLLPTSNAITDTRYPLTTVRRVPVPQQCTKKHLRVSDGMACYYQNRQYIFQNLLTGALQTIKECPYLPWGGWGFGFGYDSVDADYKMLAFSHLKAYKFSSAEIVKEYNNVFWVYSFKNGNWARRQGFPFDAFDISRIFECIACAFNGKLHWIIMKAWDRFTSILTYDLNTGEFGEIEAPLDIGYQGGYSKRNLMVLGGQLCYWNSFLGGIDVWVMNGFSWTMLLGREVELFTPKPLLGELYNQIEPVTMKECCDGRKLMLLVRPYDGSLYWYDIHNNKTDKVLVISTLDSEQVG